MKKKKKKKKEEKKCRAAFGRGGPRTWRARDIERALKGRGHGLIRVWVGTDTAGQPPNQGLTLSCFSLEVGQFAGEV